MITSKLIFKIAGKEDFVIDKNIKIDYIILQCWKYGWMLFRGRVFSLFYKKIANDVFVGKRVKVIQKKNLVMGKKCKLHENVYIDALAEEGVVLADHVLIGRGTRIECTGGLQSIGKGIKIGSRSTFANDCFFGAAGGIQIGEDVVAGQYIRFHSENHNYDALDVLIKNQGVSHKGIKIGNNCWIGSGVVFLDGAELGDGCVVAANTVVTKKFPNNCVIGGVPGKVLKCRGINQNERNS